MIFERNLSHKMTPVSTIAKTVCMNLLGSMILAFGLYHVHSFAGVTEGGVLGLTLLLHHWFDISPALSGFILNFACYLFGWYVLGKGFVVYSFVAGGAFSLFYGIFEQYPLLWSELADMPLAAAVLGALFVGVGVGLCVRYGGAPGGDDALAMGISKLSGWSIQRIYLISDLLVLTLSLSYIPWNKMIYSLITVILSGQIIGFVQRFSLPQPAANKNPD